MSKGTQARRWVLSCGHIVTTGTVPSYCLCVKCGVERVVVRLAESGEVERD